MMQLILPKWYIEYKKSVLRYVLWKKAKIAFIDLKQATFKF